MITLKTLGEATEQEVFDQVAKHLLSQGKRCQDYDNRFCKYKNDEGLKCAAGCLIGDDEYSETLEANTWRDLKYMELVPAAHSELIMKLQLIHDTVDAFNWNEELATLADDRGLSSDVLYT